MYKWWALKVVGSKIKGEYRDNKVRDLGVRGLQMVRDLGCGIGLIDNVICRWLGSAQCGGEHLRYLDVPKELIPHIFVMTGWLFQSILFHLCKRISCNFWKVWWFLTSLLKNASNVYSVPTVHLVISPYLLEKL